MGLLNEKGEFPKRPPPDPNGEEKNGDCPNEEEKNGRVRIMTNVGLKSPTSSLDESVGMVSTSESTGLSPSCFVTDTSGFCSVLVDGSSGGGPAGMSITTGFRAVSFSRNYFIIAII